MANSWLGRAILESVSNGQFCIVDRNGTGAAQFSVYINGGSAAARVPQQIKPIAYTLTPGALVSEGDRVRLRYLGDSTFYLEIIEQHEVRKFQTFEYRDAVGRHRFEERLLGAPTGDGAFLVQAPGLSFRISGYDPQTGSALLEWPKTSQPAIVPVPDREKHRPF